MQLALLIRPVLQQVSTRRSSDSDDDLARKAASYPYRARCLEELAEAQLIARRAEKRSRKKVAA
ncbi:hypothetical protein [Mesorhizobium sp. M0809]|uniref:hypothetical protein n=1 Tax=Mesorhizobium sp. M0809 TaxID=2957003 RepID=UPI003339E900